MEIKLPEKLGYLKYAVLIIFVLWLPFVTGEPWFSKLCPAGTLEAGIPWLNMNPVNPIDGQPVVVSEFIGWLFLLKMAILVGLLVLFVVSKQPFCKMLCPLGAIFALFNKLSNISNVFSDVWDCVFPECSDISNHRTYLKLHCNSKPGKEHQKSHPLHSSTSSLTAPITLNDATALTVNLHTDVVGGPSRNQKIPSFSLGISMC